MTARRNSVSSAAAVMILAIGWPALQVRAQPGSGRDDASSEVQPKGGEATPDQQAQPRAGEHATRRTPAAPESEQQATASDKGTAGTTTPAASASEQQEQAAAGDRDAPDTPPATAESEQQEQAATDDEDAASAAAEASVAGAAPAAPESEQEAVEKPETEACSHTAMSQIRYLLERVEVRGNQKTKAGVVKHFVPLQPGDLLDVDDPSIESIRWRLMGTGWFSDVRLRLERGAKRGWVVLVIDVEERNTLVIQQIVAGLSKAVRRSTSQSDIVEPYAGLGIAETNLLGLGIGVGLAGVYSRPQQGVDLQYRDPMFLGSDSTLSGRLFYNNAREFFGNQKTLVSIYCPEPDPEEEEPEECDPDVDAESAVVIYERFGLGLGTGYDLSSTLRYELDWRGELVDVENKPNAASTMRGDERVPIDFHIEDAWSTVSTIHFALIFDRRDDPPLPRRGQLLRFDARLGAGMIGSRYDFTRLKASFRHWFSLPWGHVLSPGAFAGIVLGDAPFFYRFYASDLSDLVPSRVLELNLDHRGPPDLLGTSIAAMRSEELAGRVDVEYKLPLHRGGGGIRGVDAYGRIGMYALARREDVRIAIRGYEGWARIPVDLTFDLGVRADTTVGVFDFGFSSLVRSLPDL